jgi:hypothetical protein
VIEPEAPASRSRDRAWMCTKLHERCVTPLHTEECVGCIPPHDAEPEGPFVERQRAIEVLDLEPHRPEPRRVGQPISVWRLTVTPGKRRLVTCAVGHHTSGVQGMVNENVAPGPSFDAAHRRPRWFSMMDRLTASPMPMPSAFVV